MEHLPGFKSKSSALKDKGIDTICCMAVNDVFVMDAWGKDRGVSDEMLMLADGNGDYTKALGLELDVSKYGLGMRGKRFSMVINDGVVEKLNIDPEGLKDSSAECMLGQL
jgi:peroxiredoxin